MTLSTHLLDQLKTISADRMAFQLAQYIVLCLDDNGWLTETPEEISEECGMPEDQVRNALAIVQSLDPAGVGAADYRECLLIQAKRYGMEDDVIRILESERCLQYLSNHQISKIDKALGLGIARTERAVGQIRKLNPKPGAGFGGGDTIYVVPDAYITMEGTGFSITIGDPSVPDIRINGEYADMLKETNDPEVEAYLSNCLKQAQSLIQGVTQRNQTIFRCISEIVRLQPDYFRSSSGCLTPMTMGDIAQALGCSVSTVSRTVKNKYVACCHGVVPLRSLFTAALSGKDGERGISSQQACQLILDYVRGEDRRRPLSDPELSHLLERDGLKVARRTVTKYRTFLKIPPVSQRRQRK